MALTNTDEWGHSWKVPWQQQSMGTHEGYFNRQNTRMDNIGNRSSNFLQNNKDIGDLKSPFDVNKPLTYDRFPMNIDDCPLPDSAPINPFKTFTDLNEDFRDTPSAMHLGTSLPTLTKFHNYNRFSSDVKALTPDNYSIRGPPKIDCWETPRKDTSLNWKRVCRTNVNRPRSVFNSFLSPEKRDMGRKDCKGIGRSLSDRLYVDDSLKDFVQDLRQNACLPGPRQPVKCENQRKNIYNDTADYVVSRAQDRHIPINPLSDNYLDRLDAYLENAVKLPAKSDSRWTQYTSDLKTVETQTVESKKRSASLGAEKNTNKSGNLKPRSLSTPRLKRKDSGDRLKQRHVGGDRMHPSTGTVIGGTKVKARKPHSKNRNGESDKSIRFNKAVEASASSTVFGTKCSLSGGQKRTLRGVLDDMTKEEGEFLMDTVSSILNSRLEDKNIDFTRKTKTLPGNGQHKKGTERQEREKSSDDRRCEEYIQAYCGGGSCSPSTSDSGSCSPVRSGTYYDKAVACQTSSSLPKESECEKSCQACYSSDDDDTAVAEEKPIKRNGITRKDGIGKCLSCGDKRANLLSQYRDNLYLGSKKIPAKSKTGPSHCGACRKTMVRPNERDMTPNKYQGNRAHSLNRKNSNCKSQAKNYSENFGNSVIKKRGRSREKTAKRTKTRYHPLRFLKSKDEVDKGNTGVDNSSSHYNDQGEIDRIRTPTPSPPVQKSIVQTNKKIVAPQDRIQILSLNQSFGSLLDHSQHMQYYDQFIKSTYDETKDVQPNEAIESSQNQGQNSPVYQSLKPPIDQGQKDNSNTSCSSNSTTAIAEGQDPKIDLDNLSFDVISRLSDVSLSQRIVELNLSKDHDHDSVGLIQKSNTVEPILDGDRNKEHTLQNDPSKCEDKLKQKIMLNLNRNTQTLLQRASNQILNVERFLESISSDKSATILVKEDDTTIQNEDKTNNKLNSNVAPTGLSKKASQNSISCVKTTLTSQARITANSKPILKIPQEDVKIVTVHNDNDHNKTNSSTKDNSELRSNPPCNVPTTKKKSSTSDVLNSTIKVVASGKKQLSFLYNQQSVIETGSSTTSISTSSMDSTIVSLDTSQSISCLEEGNFDDTLTYEHNHCRQCVSAFYETKSVFAQQSYKNKNQSHGCKERKCGCSKTLKPVLVKVYDVTADMPVNTSFCTFESDSTSSSEVDGFWWENPPSRKMHEISQTKVFSKDEKSSDRKQSKSLCCRQTFVNTKQHAQTCQSQSIGNTGKFAKDVAQSIDRATISSDSKKVDRQRPTKEHQIFRTRKIRKSSMKPPFRV